MPLHRIPFLNLHATYQATEDDTRAAVDRVLSRAWYVLGEEGASFEREFATYLGARYAAGVASGTDAITLALRALDVGPGSDVLTVPNTCAPTVAAIRAAGATPVFVDVDPYTLTMDPARLPEALTDRTRAIVPVHLYGHPCDMLRITAFASKHGLRVVEDCAQAHGATRNGQRCGTFGDAAAFSFYPTKNLGAFGDAGAVVTNDPDVGERLGRLRNYGLAERDWCVETGVNSRLDEVQAAVLRARLPHLDADNARRRAIADRYTEALRDTGLTLPAEDEMCRSCWHLYVVRTPHRDALRTHLATAGIGTEIHYRNPVHLQPAFESLAGGPGSFPVAEEASLRIVSLPLHPALGEADRETIIAEIRAFSP